MVTREMVVFFLNNTPKSEVISDYKDIANGKYTIIQLRRDIIETWQKRGEINER